MGEGVKERKTRGKDDKKMGVGRCEQEKRVLQVDERF